MLALVAMLIAQFSYPPYREPPLPYQNPLQQALRPKQPAPAHLNSRPPMCWVDHIEKTKSGVRVWFSDRRVVSLKHGGGGQTVFVYPPNGSGADKGHGPFPATPYIDAVLGDELFAHNMPEDSCTMAVVNEGGIALRFHATICFPVMPPPPAFGDTPTNSSASSPPCQATMSFTAAE